MKQPNAYREAGIFDNLFEASRGKKKVCKNTGFAVLADRAKKSRRSKMKVTKAQL
jgi:hypothetical protein